MNLSRAWITPVTAGAFLLSAVTGILMFFHWDSGLNKTAHEWLSWAFVTGAALHTIDHWTGVKRHLSAWRGRLAVGGFALLLALSFLPLAQEGGGGGSPVPMLASALSNAPLASLAQVAGMDEEDLLAALRAQGLQPAAGTTCLAELTGPSPRDQIRVLGALLGDTAPRQER